MTRTPTDPNVWVPGVTLPPELPARALPAPAYVGPMTRGFPRAELPVREWVPGVSTPEGLLLTSAAASAVAVAGFPILEKAVTAFTTLAIAGITTGVPAGSVWLGLSVLGR